LPPREVSDDVGRRHRDDQVTEGHHLSTHRNDVAEHDDAIGRALEMARSTKLHERDLVGGDDLGSDEGSSAHGHAAVGDDGEQVDGEADGHHSHAGEMQVGDTERHQAAQRDRGDDHCGGAIELCRDELAGDTGDERADHAHPGTSEARGTRAQCEPDGEAEHHGSDGQQHLTDRTRFRSTVRVMAYEALLYEVNDGVATITINRPERRNALSWTVMSELRAAFEAAKADREVRVVTLTGAGDKAFCAGADLTGMRADAGWAEVHDGRGELTRLFRTMWELGKPIVARVRGYALAGGFGLCLACDLVVAADDAQFGTPEIDVGLWPFMITVPLVRSMPPKVALELMMTGRRVSAEEALRIGFVNRVVPVAELDAAVAEITATLAAKSPAIMKLGRDSFYAVWDQPAEEALRLLHSMLTITSATDDAAEGIAAFAEKRQPVWRGR
jgi:enoyl-CoA hydratase/carnithine racemase